LIGLLSIQKENPAFAGFFATVKLQPNNRSRQKSRMSNGTSKIHMKVNGRTLQKKGVFTLNYFTGQIL
jgi:hypothetical protein